MRATVPVALDPRHLAEPAGADHQVAGTATESESTCASPAPPRKSPAVHLLDRQHRGIEGERRAAGARPAAPASACTAHLEGVAGRHRQPPRAASHSRTAARPRLAAWPPRRRAGGGVRATHRRLAVAGLPAIAGADAAIARRRRALEPAEPSGGERAATSWRRRRLEAETAAGPAAARERLAPPALRVSAAAACRAARRRRRGSEDVGRRRRPAPGSSPAAAAAALGGWPGALPAPPSPSAASPGRRPRGSRCTRRRMASWISSGVPSLLSNGPSTSDSTRGLPPRKVMFGSVPTQIGSRSSSVISALPDDVRRHGQDDVGALLVGVLVREQAADDRDLGEPGDAGVGVRLVGADQAGEEVGLAVLQADRRVDGAGADDRLRLAVPARHRAVQVATPRP